MTEKGGIGGLGFEQDDLTEQALDLHVPLGVDISLGKRQRCSLQQRIQRFKLWTDRIHHPARRRVFHHSGSD